MDKRIVEFGKTKIAVISSDNPIITDAQSALDLLATIQYCDDCDRIALYKGAVAEGFFKLSTGIAGEVLQKFINYKQKLAIIGDFSCYTSKPLHDFIHECNSGKDVFFVETEQEALDRLSKKRQLTLTANGAYSLRNATKRRVPIASSQSTASPTHPLFFS